MAALPIYTYGHPVLRERAREVLDNEDIQSLVEDMFETMHNAQGIGLAGNQVGILKRIIVIDISGIEEHKDVQPMVLINPEKVEENGVLEMEEGCLSIPTLRDNVTRSEAVTVRYKDKNFNELTITVSGLLARVILHEIDHLNGVLFIDHLTPGRRKFHRGTLNSIKKGELEVSYPIVVGEELIKNK